MIGGSNRLIGTDELAAFLGVHRDTVHKRWREWGLPGIKFGGQLRFRERDVATWLEQREAATAQEAGS